LRGINVGGHNLIPMTRLRAIYEGLGCEDVETYLQSGNVVFRRRGAPGRVSVEAEGAIRDELGIGIRIIGRTHDQLVRTVETDPFPEADPSRRLVMFLEEAPAPEIARDLGRLTSGEDVAVLIDKEFHLHCPAGIGQTKLTGLLSDRRLGVTTTGRNWRTVTRLVQLSGPQS
jgi:uncharacterized protein (DUF1697 family)